MKNVMRKRFVAVGIFGLLLFSPVAFGSDEADGGTGDVERWNFPSVSKDSFDRDRTAGTSKYGSTRSSADVRTGLVVLVPATVANPVPADGCWVQVFEEDNYGGDSVLVAGPRSLPNIKQSVAGHSFRTLGESVVAGPNARVTLYEDENFGGRSVDVEANYHISEVDESFGPFEQMASLRVACTG
jgi:hypothetical protein